MANLEPVPVRDDFASINWARPDYSPIWNARAERLRNLRENPGMLAGVKAYYRDHPADFLNDWGITQDPRMADIGLDPRMPFILFPKQREYVGWLHDHWRNRKDGLVEKARDMGVSYLCVGFAVWMFLFHPNTCVGFGSRKEELVDNMGDPKSLFWKIRNLIEGLPKEFKPKGWHLKSDAPFMRVMNRENGSSIIGEAGDNIGRGGRSSVYFKDESAFYERPDIIDAALSQNSNCKIDVSTPNGAGNPFYRKRHGGKIDVFTFRYKDDPRKADDIRTYEGDRNWYEYQRYILDSHIVAQEIDINYEASITDSFIPGDIVTDAINLGPADVEQFGATIWGLDVARFGDDKSVLTCRRGRVVQRQQVWGQVDTQWLANEVWTQAQAADPKPDQIAVDVIGVGAGVVDRLKELARGSEVRIEGVNSANKVTDGRNFNLRAKMWDEMREWLKDAPVSIPNDGELKAELTALRYLFKNGLRLMESKDDARKRGIKSPDQADSLALTFARPVLAARKPLSFESQFTRAGSGVGNFALEW